MNTGDLLNIILALKVIKQETLRLARGLPFMAHSD